MIFHYNTILNFKIVLKSASFLLVSTAIIFIVDLIFKLEASTRIYFYIAPFTIHTLLSFFMKNKASWMFGAIIGTLTSILLFLIMFFIFLK